MENWANDRKLYISECGQNHRDFGRFQEEYYGERSSGGEN